MNEVSLRLNAATRGVSNSRMERGRSMMKAQMPTIRLFGRREYEAEMKRRYAIDLSCYQRYLLY